MIRKIFFSNMCTDDNKGDLSIIQSSVKLIKNIYPLSSVIIQNADYSRADVVRFRIDRFSKKISDRYHGSFFPKVYSKKGQNRIKPVARLGTNFGLSSWILFCAFLARVLRRKFMFLIPGRHREAWRDLYESDLVIVKGGSYIYSYGGIRQILFTWRMLFTPLLAILLRKRTVLFGHSIGPVEGGPMVSLAKYVLHRVDKTFLREKLSYDYVNQTLGLNEEKLGLIPDLAFLYDLPPAVLPQETIAKMVREEGIPDLSSEDVLIGLTVRDWWFPGKKNPQRLRENYIRIVIASVDFMREKFQSKILFIPHCLEDLEFVDEITARLRDRKNVFILRKDYSPDELRNILRILKMLIGTRIHSTILALTVGIPVIAIAYEIHKGYGILEMAGREDYILDISRLTKEDLISRINIVMEQHRYVQDRIRVRVSELKRELEKKADDYFRRIP